MKTPAVREKLESAGLKFVSDDRTTPDYLAKFVRSEITKWAAPIKSQRRQCGLTRRVVPRGSMAVATGFAAISAFRGRSGAAGKEKCSAR